MLIMSTHYIGPERRRRPRDGWRSTWLGKIVGRLWYIVAFSNTMQTRLFLVIAATLWACALLVPGDSFARPTFAYMAAIAPEPWWTATFALYAAVTFVRIFSDWNGRVAALVINGVGAALFSAIAFAVVTLPGKNFPAGSAAHCAIALAAVWVFVRTHVNSPRDWQHD